MTVWGTPLSPTAKLLLLCMSAHVSEGECRLTQAELATATGLHRNSVRSLLIDLENAGRIETAAVLRSNTKTYRILT